MKRRYSPARQLTPNQAKRKHVAIIEALAGREIPELRAGLVPAKSIQPRAKLVRREAPILKDILNALSKHPRVEECWRQQAGQIAIAGGFIRLGKKGKLDIAGRLKAGGRYFEIEVKAPGEKPKPHQYERIEYVRSTGGVAGWATCIAEAIAIIEGG